MTTSSRYVNQDHGPVIVTGDCNAPQTVDEIRSHIESGSLGLAFVDNLGLTVPFATLSTLTAGRQVDLMITFQVGDLTRNVVNVMQGREDRQRFDAFFGSADWASIVTSARARNASSAEIANDLLDFYAQQLGSIGYSHVAHSRKIMKNSRNVAQYRLLLAGKHERAVQFFEKIQEIDPTGQRGFF